jgi:copper resistance protein C
MRPRHRTPLGGSVQMAAVALVFATVAFSFTTTGRAFAHAHYDHSTPSIGQVLAAAPQRIDIYTDSEMRKLADANHISVTAADGSAVDDGITVLDDANRQHFSVGLQPNLPEGRYVVSFKTLSDVDGDTDSGKFSFYVGAGPTDAQKQLDATLNGQPVTIANPPSNAGSPPVALIAGGGVLALVAIAAGIVALSLRRRSGAAAS